MVKMWIVDNTAFWVEGVSGRREFGYRKFVIAKEKEI